GNAESVSSAPCRFLAHRATFGASRDDYALALAAPDPGNPLPLADGAAAVPAPGVANGHLAQSVGARAALRDERLPLVLARTSFAEVDRLVAYGGKPRV